MAWRVWVVQSCSSNVRNARFARQLPPLCGFMGSSSTRSRKGRRIRKVLSCQFEPSSENIAFQFKVLMLIINAINLPKFFNYSLWYPWSNTGLVWITKLISGHLIKTHRSIECFLNLSHYSFRFSMVSHVKTAQIIIECSLGHKAIVAIPCRALHILDHYFGAKAKTTFQR